MPAGASERRVHSLCTVFTEACHTFTPTGRHMPQVVYREAGRHHGGEREGLPVSLDRGPTETPKPRPRFPNVLFMQLV